MIKKYKDNLYIIDTKTLRQFMEVIEKIHNQ